VTNLVNNQPCELHVSKLGCDIHYQGIKLASPNRGNFYDPDKTWEGGREGGREGT
jgi:hypothetical protein